MSGIDDNIVSMKFDNENFERKISDTLKSLDKLKASLDFTNSKRSMDELSTASKKFDMHAMGSAIDGVSNKFLAMATIGITALANITSRAVDAGARFLNAFTFAPIMDGFREFETNMNSIQTILANTASKGTSLDDVNAALQKLNEYSDKTIYNFGQMARNIGTFTAAGIDLDTSVNAIKGIANLAAVSGSSADQASSAMYQLSQALATGTLKLIDWNSVVNAGMGGEVFKNALFETGKALGKLGDIPMDTTFKEWEAANGSFRESLQDGWVTSDVLTTALGTFTGDLSDAQLKAKGFTDAQIDDLQKMAKTAVGAATEVKTFTQLIGTVKEAIGTGWADSFKILIGGFDESKELFTGINNVIGLFVGRSADARNAILADWKNFGGRDAMLEGFKNVLVGIGSIIKPIKEAFREIFPKKTAADLLVLTQRFGEFAKNLKIGGETADKLKRVFSGFFSVFSIGWEIIKAFGSLVKDVFSEIFGAFGSDALNFAATTGDTLTNLRTALVEGGGIKDFFEGIGDVIKTPIQFLKDFKENVEDLFKAFKGGGGKETESAFGRIGDRMDTLGRLAERVGEAWRVLTERFRGVGNVLGEIWDYISNWFSELGEKLAAVMKPQDFDAAVDVVNVGLLGGIVLILKRFLSGGLNLDFGGGLFQKISETFGELTGVLKAMQTDLKAKALLKIAAAVGVLTVAVFVLSTIDSVALTKALTAMAVGFGQLVTTMALLNNMTTTAGAAKLAIVAGGLILLAGAIVVLSLAVKFLSTMGWEELAKGLLGVTVLLTGLTAATNLIASDTSGMIRAGIAMMGISVALLILSLAVKAFATMEWEEMGKGLVGVAGGLLILVAGTNAMPAGGMVGIGAGLILVSIGLRVLAEAVQAFSEFSWTEMGKGLVGIGVGLGILVLLTNTMPAGGLVGIGVGLTLVSVALNIMARAVKEMAEMKFGDMAKGLGGLAAMLLVLVVATNAMNGAMAGAAAMIIVSGALLIMSHVLQELSKLSLTELATGLGAIAGVFVILGLAALILSPATGALLGLGAALILVGAGFALFGVGAALLAKAFEIIAKTGKAGVEVLIEAIEMLLQATPGFVQAVAEAILELGTAIVEGAPVLIKGLGVLLGHILDTVIELAPKLGEALATVFIEALKFLRETFPEFVEAGIDMLQSFLEGIRDHIGEITAVVGDIITNFLDAFAEEVPGLIESLVELLVTVFEEVAFGLGELVPRLLIGVGRKFLEGFWTGITEELGALGRAIGEIITKVIDWFKSGFGIFSPSRVMMDIGKNIVQGLLNGILSVANLVYDWFIKFPAKVIGFLGNTALTLVSKGVGFIYGLLAGVIDKAAELANWFIGLGAKVLGWVGNTVETLKNKGYNLIVGFLSGAMDKIVDVKNWFLGLDDKILDWLGDIGGSLFDLGKQVMEGLWNGMKDIWDDTKDWLSNLNPANWFNDINPYKGHAIKNLVSTGAAVMQGLWNGMEDGWSNVANWLKTIDPSQFVNVETITAFNKSFKDMRDQFTNLDVSSPVITPVVDMTNVEAAARSIEKMIDNVSLSTDISVRQANLIAAMNNASDDQDDDSPSVPSGPPTFIQNNYSPKALSVKDIYRNTKSQIALVKEELGVP